MNEFTGVVLMALSDEKDLYKREDKALVRW